MTALPAFFADRLRQGIRLPPGGWALAGMLAFYVLAGLFGRDPWKGEDAVHIGTAWQMLAHGGWLTPELAGRPFHEPPLFYWSAALTGQLFGSVLPVHDAMRMASGVWVALALVGLYYAGRELYGQDSAAASPMLLAGSIGLLIHAHNAQPMLVALAAYGGGLGALAGLARRPRLTGALYGLAVATCLLGAGIAPTLPLLALAPIAIALSADKRRARRAGLGGLLLGIALSLVWPMLLWQADPAHLTGWLRAELAPIRTPELVGERLRYLLALLPWFAFPAFPLAAWTLWSYRRQWRTSPARLPLAALALTGATCLFALPASETTTLLLLPVLALIATPGALSLRRGAANAFDWFAMMTFTLFGALAWLAWTAIAFGMPARLAERAQALRPGFHGQVDSVALALGGAVTLWWIWLIFTAPRSAYRSLMHWTLGFTSLWLLVNALLLPWVDYGNSYRPVVEALARQLPAERHCLAETGLTNSQRAMVSYYARLTPVSLKSAPGRECDWLLLAGNPRQTAQVPDGGWQRVWEGGRPGNRRERFVLLRRGTPE